MPLTTLKFNNLGPFDEAEFEFDPHVNVFVGPNNCGKSTLLLALADIAVLPFWMPKKLLRSMPSKFHVRQNGARRKNTIQEGTFPIILPKKGGEWDKNRSLEYEKFRDSLGYTTFVPALRWTTDFRSEGPLRDAKRKRRHTPSLDEQVTLAQYYDIDDEALQARPSHERGPDATLVRDAEIVQEVIELDYRAYRQNKPAIREIIAEIASIASEITEGFPIKFAGIGEDENGLYPQFHTPDGIVALNVLSQGTQSLIQWIARLLIGYAKHFDFPASLKDRPGVLIIDEIDAHLHPSWQRRIIPAITKTFPSLQLFCSTHSPLMLAGLKAGQVHLLTRDRKGKVVVSRNESDIIGWSADEIATTFLGIEHATDLQTEQDLQRLQELRAKKRLTPKQRAEFESLRDKAGRRLLSEPAVEEIDRLAERLNRALKKPPARGANSTQRASARPSARRKRDTTSRPKRVKK